MSFVSSGERLDHLAFGAAGAGAGARAAGATGLIAGAAAIAGAGAGAAIAGAGGAIGLTAIFTAALGAFGAAIALLNVPGTASPSATTTTSLLAQ